MSKKRPKKFKPLLVSDDPEKIREQLQSLKDKEAKLEADLAIKEFPDLEEGFAVLVLAMADVKRAREFLQVADGMEHAMSRRHDTLMAQLENYGAKLASATTPATRAMYQQRIETAEQMLDESEEVTRYRALRQHIEDASAALLHHHEVWAARLAAHRIDLQTLLPEIAEFVDSHKSAR